MGFKVDFTGDGGGSKAPLAPGKYEVRLQKFVSGESSQKKTPYVQVVFTNQDEDAVDTEGESYGKRPVYGDTFYLTPKATWRLKKFASQAGVELPDGEQEFDSLAEFAAELTDAFEGDYVVETDLEEYENSSGETKKKVVVVSVQSA